MRHTTLLVSLALTCYPLTAISDGARTLCRAPDQEQMCQIYIQGIVEGYLASKTANISHFSVNELASDYEQRAYTTRGSYRRLQHNQQTAICIPQQLDVATIASQFSDSLTIEEVQEDITSQFAQYLKQHYDCKLNS
ncbi:hypothetical protein [Thalassotalea maritima]|uniref:hypothetical protein n=1 Tax=Thalassotalea maritima TaxID=3242416 RepID=UPI003528E61F